jgi:hypothetical protein
MSDDAWIEVPGETTVERGVRKALFGQKSEFGEGTVLCLMYWVKHWENDSMTRVREAIHAQKSGQKPKSVIDSVSHTLQTWANGASDHLYGIKVPSKARPELARAINTLRDKALKMGHGLGGNKWTEADLDDLWELTKKVALGLDIQILGVADADEGSWQ